MAYKLIAQKGPSAGTSYSLEQQEIFMGRDLSNDIVVNDPEISRRHARLYRQGEHFIVEDLGSTNGTVVNGQRIRGPLQLTNQDHITIGQSIAFVFVDDRPPLVASDATVAADSFNPLDVDATMMASEKDSFDVYTPPAFTPAPPHIPTEFTQTPDYTQDEDPQFPSTPQWQATPTPVMPASASMKSATSSSNSSTVKKKIPVWLIIVAILLLIACVCVGGLFAIDQLNLWCDILPFLPGCPIV